MSEANSKLSEQEIEGGPNVTVTDPEESVTATPKENVKDTDSSNDPYAYLERDFSSENFKIKIKNLPKCYGIHVSIKCSWFEMKQLHFLFLSGISKTA